MPPAEKITTLVTEQAKKPFKKPNLKVVSIVIGLIILSFAGFMLYKNQSLTKTNPKSQPSTTSKSAQKRSPSPSTAPKLTVRESMDRDIKFVFDNKTYLSINSLATLALNEKDSNKRYADYVKIFQEMVKVYNQSKDSKQKQVLVELRNYNAINPIYKESDWVMPK